MLCYVVGSKYVDCDENTSDTNGHQVQQSVEILRKPNRQGAEIVQETKEQSSGS